MNHDTSVLDEGENKLEFLIEQIPVQDSLTSLQIREQPTAESSLHPVQLIEALLDQLVARTEAIGDEYLERIRSAKIEFMDSLDRRAGSTPSSRLDSNIHLEIKHAEDVFAGQIRDAASGMKGRHETLREDIKSLKRGWGMELFEKIIQTEDLVLNEDIRIQRRIHDATVEVGELGYLMRACARNREMKAYLQGLRFRFLERAEL